MPFPPPIRPRFTVCGGCGRFHDGIHRQCIDCLLLTLLLFVGIAIVIYFRID